MPVIATPPPANARRDFTIYASLTKAWKKKAVVDDVEREELYLSGIASSTVRDRQGDTMSAKAQASMLEQARGLTMFLNHDYDVPEDVLGTCEESNLVASKAADGSDIMDLEIVCRVTQANPRAAMAHAIVADGVTLGFSIGGEILECEIDEENDDGESWCPPLIIDDLALYEISLCGIPANPRAYTDQQKQLILEAGVPSDTAPEPTANWALAMRRGFVKSATRNPQVRAMLRKALPALREHLQADVEPPLVRDDGDATEDGTPELDPDVQAKVAYAMGCMQRSLEHGMCAESMKHAKDAHECLAGLLTPDGDDPDGDSVPDETGPDDQPSDQPNDTTLSVSPDTAAAEQKLQRLSALAEETSAKLTSLDATIAERSAAAADAQAKLDALKAETDELQARAEALRSQPAGRATVAGGDAGRRTSSTLHEAQRNLGAALSGQRAPANDAIRPA